MAELTAILEAIERGDSLATGQLLPAVYDELRRLAAHKLAREARPHARRHGPRPRGVPASLSAMGTSRGQARRGATSSPPPPRRCARILIDRATRTRGAESGGGGRARHSLDDVNPAAPEASENLLAIDEALERLAGSDAVKAELVKLRFFAGLTLEQAAAVLDISPATADRYWAYARVWLLRGVWTQDESTSP